MYCIFKIKDDNFKFAYGEISFRDSKNVKQKTKYAK